MKGLALVLIIVGLIMTLVTGVKYFTKEKVVDIGNLEVTADKPRTVNWSPLLGIGVMVVGGIIYIADRKK